MSKKASEVDDVEQMFDKLSDTMQEDGAALYEAVYGCGLEKEKFNETLLRQMKVIQEKANILSLLCFVEIVKKNEHSERAVKGHSARTEGKNFVQAEWRKYQADYENNKSAFCRDYVKRMKNEFEIEVTEKHMRENWLKDAT